jgi:signal transduction histidine kinase
MISIGAAIAGSWSSIASRRALLWSVQAVLSAESAERARDAARTGEQQRLSRELHDLLGHRLAALNLLLEAHIRTVENGEVLLLMRTQISQARRELDELVDLRRTPASRESPTVGDLLESFRTLDVDVRSTVDAGYESLPRPYRLLVDRFVRESVTNAIKYAAAGPIWVTVRVTETSLDVKCTSLVGGTPAVRERSEGAVGLTGLDARASLLGGRVSWSRGQFRFVVLLSVPV